MPLKRLERLEKTVHQTEHPTNQNYPQRLGSREQRRGRSNEDPHTTQKPPGQSLFGGVRRGS